MVTQSQTPMPRILVVDHRMVTPDRDAGSLRMWRLLKILLSLGWEVTYATVDLSDTEPWVSRLLEMGVTVLRPPFNPSLKRHLRRQGAAYDAVWLCRVSVAQGLLNRVRKHCPRAKLIFDTVDLHYLREQREAELSGSARAMKSAAETRRTELGVVRRVDATVLVSAEEARRVQEVCPDSDLRIISMIHDPLADIEDFEGRRGILFVGGFDHRPNQDGAEWFVSEILPRVRQSLPEEPFWIVGSGASRFMRDLSAPGVTVVGWVNELDSIYSRSRISVAPLRYGAGVKGKITQSLARGVPCVATSMACEGMPLTHQKSVLIADDDASFAAAVIRLYEDRDLWRSLSANGLEVVRAHFSRDLARRQMADLLDRAIG
jgi:glycosyltransferase involved in cell wall biosynthesis